MRRLILASIFALAGIAPTLADPQPLEQRIAAQIGNLSIQNAGQAIQIEQLQTALGIAQTRVKALEDKYEPKNAPQAPKEQ